MSEQKVNQNNKCKHCQFYDKENDVCKAKGKTNCSKTDFSKCTDFLVNEKFVMF